MVKRISLALLMICIISFTEVSVTSAQTLQITNGLSYLLTAQNPDGSWTGSVNRGMLPTTVAAMETLSMLGQGNTQNYINAAVWVQAQKTQDMTTTDYLSKRICALSVSGTDQDLLISYIDDMTGAWSGEDSPDVDNLDTALALHALKKINHPDQDVISSALFYLTSTQNIDGGWGFYQGDDSSVYMTALVSMTLQQFPQTTAIATAINKATSYLIAHQNADGGFGDSPSTVYETALAYMALAGASADATVRGSAINYITSAQLPNGSWEDDPYSTALALRVLANVKPNLIISPSDITFSNPTPTVGETITIIATIHNTGTAQTDNVLVQFYDDAPSGGGVFIGDTTIPSIPSFGSAEATISWTISSASAQQVFVTIDPSNTIEELNEDDNIALKNVTASALPDVSITPADIIITPSTPELQTSLGISVIVRNHGEIPATDVLVKIYDGNPALGGTLLREEIINAIPGGGSGNIDAVIEPASVISGSKDIYVFVDQLNTVTEADETNNTAVKTVRIGGLFPDLVIGRYIVWEPVYPAAGMSIPLTAAISNLGNIEAANVRVRFYLGDPEAGGAQIGSDAIISSIPAGGEANAIVTWDTTGRKGKNYIYVVVDPLDQIQEQDELNNKTLFIINVAASTGANIMVSDGEITFNPSSPVSGAIVTVSAVIRNNGSATANNIVVEFSDGDPRVPGTRIIGRQEIPTLTGNIYGSTTVQMVFDTSGLTGPHDIYVSVDPFNEIAEADERDNLASALLEIRQPQGPDATVTDIETSNLLINQTLQASGSVQVTVENKGSDPITQPFEIIVFEDRNLNKKYDAGSDNRLGVMTYTNALGTGESGVVEVGVAGEVLFKDNILFVMTDSGNTLAESNEENNLLDTSYQCVNESTCEKFDVVQKFAFTTTANIYTVPMVANLTDDNGDGMTNGLDTPDIIFHNGCVIALSGDDGHVLFNTSNCSIHQFSHLAVGDIDNDGLIEIIGFSQTNKALIAFENDGTQKWISHTLSMPSGSIQRWAISIADLDGDGTPELISGPNVLNNDGTLRWSLPVYDGIPVVADLDMDGVPEILIGNSAYRNDGTLYWKNTTFTTERVAHAVANLDSDPYPEIIQVIDNTQYGVMIYAFEHDGQLKWGPVRTYISGWAAAPSIGDFDGDGQPEIGVSGMYRYTVLKANGSILWQSVVMDGTYGGLSAAVFDFDGDGAAEIVHNDMQYLRIYRGKDGTVLFSTPNSTATMFEYPTVADVDNDGSAEIITCANFGYTYNYRGIRVFENRCDNWPTARKIWNEYNYHITNVNDDGTIPAVEENSWTTLNNYRQTPALRGNAWSKPDITSSHITVDQTQYPDSVAVSVRIGNGGAQSQPPGIGVSIYDGDPSQGGVLIGTAQTGRLLRSGEYEDISIVWSAPTEGVHILFAAADAENGTDECWENNNIAFGSVNITGILLNTDLPDLSVSPSDIAITPPEAIEGQPAIISAIIHNEGVKGISDVVVAFYDGGISNGGTLIGSVTKAYIDAGATALAEISWNTFGQSGRNYIHVIADPGNTIQESNENNNATLKAIDVTLPAKPDLAVTATDITFSNLNPAVGELLMIQTTVHNLGTAVGSIKVSLYDGDPSSVGILLAEETIMQIIPFGGIYTTGFTFDTAGSTGNHDFYVIVDPDNIVDEVSETNNKAWNFVTIGPADLTLGILTDKTIYTAAEDIQISVVMGNLLASARSGELEVKIVDLRANVVSTISSQPVTLAPNENRVFTFTWNTGTTFAGDYKVYCYFRENGDLAAKADAPIMISPVQNISTKITADKTAYFTNQTVNLTSTIQSMSQNYVFEGLSAVVTVKDSLGMLLHTETNSVAVFLPLQIMEFKTYWNTSTNPPGIYPVTLEVRDALGAILSTSTTNLTISDQIAPSRLLRGTITVDRQSLLQGEPVNISYSVTNAGNIELSQVDLSILTVHVVNQTVYDTLTDQTSLAMGALYSNSQQLNTNSYTAKDYLVILRATISGVEETLAGTYFRVEGAPSAPSLSSPQFGDDVETLTPVLTVNNASDPNDDELTYEFELYSDSGLTNLIASSGAIGEGIDVTSWQLLSALTENATYYWRARAYDGMLYSAWMSPASFRVNVENDPPTAPILSSPADNAETDTLTPLLTVANATDPDSSNLTYNFEVSPDPEFAQLVISEMGIFEGTGTTSWQIPLNLNENTSYYWRAQADDWLIEGPWMTPARFFVNTANDAPTAPVILSPSNNEEITALFADIVIANSTDPDSPQLTYLFEIDTVNTFDSATIIRSGTVAEGQGTTLWHSEGLSDNTLYYLRAKASDGFAESPWSDITEFFVTTVNDPPTIPVLANPSEGSGVNTFTPTLSVHNATDIDRDILTYEFEVYADEAMANLVANITSIEETAQITSWTMPLTLAENMTYYWRTRAFDGELHSGWMPLSSFMVNTANDAPTAPHLHAPAEGSSLDTQTPTLSVSNATDPDSDILTYDFEIYTGGALVQSITGIPQDMSGITSVTLSNALSDNTTYTWRARAYDGDRYGAWMDMATFSVHLPVTSITATINFDPDTLNQKSKGNWVTVYIELPSGYNVADIIISSIRLNDTIPAETWPFSIGDNDHDGIQDLMVKFKRAAVINLLPDGDTVQVTATGTVGTTTFEGVDFIRVIH